MKKPLVRQSHKTKRVLASCGSAAVRRKGRLGERLLGIADVREVDVQAGHWGLLRWSPGAPRCDHKYLMSSPVQPLAPPVAARCLDFIWGDIYRPNHDRLYHPMIRVNRRSPITIYYAQTRSFTAIYRLWARERT